MKGYERDLNENGWKAIDTSAGEFLDLKQPSSKEKAR